MTPNDDTTISAPVPHFLGTARDRVAGQIQDAQTHLPEAEVLTAELDQLVGRIAEALAATDGARGEPSDPSLLSLRLLELLRVDLLREWPDDGTGSGNERPPLLHLMRTLEDVRTEVSREEPGHLGAPVFDPWARELLGEVAHTLGSSFSSMVFLTEVLASGQSGEVSELQRSQLRILYRAALQMGSTAGDILRLSGPFEEPEKQSPVRFSVTELLEEVGAVLAPIVEEKEMRLEIIPPASPDRTGRPLALRRALVGLSLAATGTAAGGTVVLRASDEGAGTVAFSISSDRPGIEGDQPVIQDVFRQHPRRAGYTLSLPALGIAAARDLLRSLHSELQVDYESDSGLQLGFSLSLPREPGD